MSNIPNRPFVLVITREAILKTVGVVFCATLLALGVMRVASLFSPSGIKKLTNLHLSANGTFFMRGASKNIGVLGAMFSIGFAKFQVVDGIIEAISVFMVNDLCGKKFSPKMLFHDYSVLKSSNGIDANNLVPVTHAATAKHMVAIATQGFPSAGDRAKPLLSTFARTSAWNKFFITVFTQLRLHLPNITLFCRERHWKERVSL